jgi:uncharacterized protein
MKQKQILALFICGFFLVWINRATWFYSLVDLRIQGETQRLVFSNVIKFILWVIPAIGYMVWKYKENPLWITRVFSSVNWNGLLYAFGASAVYFAALLIFQFVIAHQTLSRLFQSSPQEIWTGVVSIFFSPIIEEFFFRGFLLAELEKQSDFWNANLLQSVLFVLIHLPNWMWINGFQTGLAVNSISIFILAVLLGWITKRTNSIWPSVIVHFLNNFLAAFLG